MPRLTGHDPRGTSHKLSCHIHTCGHDLALQVKNRQPLLKACCKCASSWKPCFSCKGAKRGRSPIVVAMAACYKGLRYNLPQYKAQTSLWQSPTLELIHSCSSHLACIPHYNFFQYVTPLGSIAVFTHLALFWQQLGFGQWKRRQWECRHRRTHQKQAMDTSPTKVAIGHQAKCTFAKLSNLTPVAPHEQPNFGGARSVASRH